MEEQIYTSATLRDYLKVLFRQKLVLAVTFITVMVVVTIGLIFKTPVYQAQVKMLISAQKMVESPYYTALGLRDMGVSLTQSEIVNSNPVLERTVRALGLYARPLDYEKRFSSIFKKPFIILGAKNMERRLKKATEDERKGYLYRMALEDLRARIKVEPIRDTNMFTISVSDYSPVGAAILANAVSRSYVIFDLEQQLAETQLKYGEKHPTSIQLKDSIEKMNKNLTGQPLSDVEAIGPASVKVVEQAQVPIRSAGIPKSMTFILAFFMSIFLGVMLAFTFDYLDQTFKSPDEVENFLNLPYLGSFPHKVGISSYHDLADQLYLLMKDKNLKSIQFSSAKHAEGTTPTVVNLAKYLSKIAGHKVLIIDANLRDPSLQRAFKLPDNQGLIDVLEDKLSFDRAVKEVEPNLYVLPAGKSTLNPVTILDSHMMHDLLKAAKEKYKVVLIDSAPLRDYRDGSLLATYSDAVVIVIDEGSTRKQVVKAAIEPLLEKKAVILGVILNNRTFPIPEKIYHRI